MNLDVSRGDTGAASVTVTVRGELDSSTAYDVYTAAVAEAQHAAGTVVVDLSGVTFVDSVGLGMLVRTRDELATDLQSRLVLRAPSENVLRILTLTALLDQFTVTDGGPNPG